jgi:hypothetical protein
MPSIMTLEAFNELAATLSITSKNEVYIGLYNGRGPSQYYKLDPISSNLIYIEGPMLELEKEIAHFQFKNEVNTP